VLISGLWMSLLCEQVPDLAPTLWGDPHILLKDGITVAAAVESGKTFDEKEQALALEVTYDLTGARAALFKVTEKNATKSERAEKWHD